MSPLKRPTSETIFVWYSARGMVNADGTIQAHNEADRRFVEKLSRNFGQYGRIIQRELIKAHGEDRQLLELLAEGSTP